VGLFLVYIITPTPELIIKYPTPENAKELVFEDDSQNCYKFYTQEVPCPQNPEEIPIERKIETFSSGGMSGNVNKYKCQMLR
jgi:hypothetical protein